MKSMYVYGAECYDFVHYLSRVLTELGERVLVIDHSKNQSFALSVPMTEEDRSMYVSVKSKAVNDEDFVISMNGVSFAATDKVSGEYDKYIYLMGTRPMGEPDGSMKVLVIDEDVHSINYVTKLNLSAYVKEQAKEEEYEDDEDEPKRRKGVVFGGNKDAGQESVENCLLYVAIISPAAGEIFKKFETKFEADSIELSVVDTAEADMLAKYYCCQNERFKFQGIQNGYKDVLADVAIKLTRADKKTVKTAIRRAEKGV